MSHGINEILYLAINWKMEIFWEKITIEAQEWASSLKAAGAVS